MALSPDTLHLAAMVVASPAAMLGLRLTAERRWAAHPERAKGAGVNLAAWAGLLVGPALAAPALGGFVTMALNAAGGGLLVLPSHGIGWWAGLAVYFLAMDFGEFAFHRAQHAIPALWAMHSLHHSDRHFDATTAARHFWLEPAIKSVTIWLAVGMLFRTPASVALVWSLVSFWHYVVHSNTRLDFGRGSWALNAPGYHRIHHSRDEAHFDVNFASLFPIFDVLGGTYRPLRAGETVRTGLDTGEAPERAWEALAWPLRRLWRRRRPSALATTAQGL